MAKTIRRLLILCLVLCISVFCGIFAAACNDETPDDNKKQEEVGGNEDEGDTQPGPSAGQRPQGEEVAAEDAPVPSNTTAIEVTVNADMYTLTFTGAVLIEFANMDLDAGSYKFELYDANGEEDETLRGCAFYVEKDADRDVVNTWEKNGVPSMGFIGSAINIDENSSKRLKVMISAPEGQTGEMTIKLLVSANAGGGH